MFDDVRGTVIGDVTISWQLFYDGRSQSQKNMASDDKAAITAAKELKACLITEFAGHPCYLYQEDKWEVRIQ